MSKLAVITGANKGIGYAIVQILGEKLTPANEWTIYLTSRNEELGKKALAELPKLPVNIKYRQLDITNAKSLTDFARHIKDDTKGIDILINNAGAANQDPNLTWAERAEATCEINFFCTLAACESLLPLMKKNSRLVNVTSTAGLFALKELSPELQKRFTSPMTLQQVKDSVNEFLQVLKDEKVEGSGWPNKYYHVSKMAAIKMTFILAEQYANDERNIVINSCCPGSVKTDLNANSGTKTPMEGADTPCYLALLPIGAADIPIGKHLSDRKIDEWVV